MSKRAKLKKFSSLKKIKWQFMFYLNSSSNVIFLLEMVGRPFLGDILKET